MLKLCSPSVTASPVMRKVLFTMVAFFNPCFVPRSPSPQSYNPRLPPAKMLLINEMLLKSQDETVASGRTDFIS